MLNSLKRDIREYEKQEGKIEDYKKLERDFRTSDEITEVMFTEGKWQLLDGSTKKRVNIDVLKEKRLLLPISTLDIEVLVLKLIYDEMMKEKYRIVEIPMVQLPTDLPGDFQELQSEIPWYMVQGFTSSVGMRLIKSVSNFENWPLLVVNPQGRVEHPNSLHMVHKRVRAFPFTITKEEELLGQENVMEAILKNINEDINFWVKEKKYIFYYGGKDNSWIEQFEEKATSLKGDMEEEYTISFELLYVKNKDNFWSYLFFCKTREKAEADPLMLEIQKWLSYKNENGWAVLYEGSRMVSSGHGTIILEVFNQFGEWKGDLPEKGFKKCFLECLKKFSKNESCCHIDIPITAEVEHLNCPYCSSEMETYHSFKLPCGCALNALLLTERISFN